MHAIADSCNRCNLLAISLVPHSSCHCLIVRWIPKLTVDFAAAAVAAAAVDDDGGGGDGYEVDCDSCDYRLQNYYCCSYSNSLNMVALGRRTSSNYCSNLYLCNHCCVGYSHLDE